MSKKTKKQIKDYYSKVDVVASYDDKRFAGIGGKYIHNNELEPIMEYIDKIEKEKKRKLKVLDLGAGRGRLSIPLKKKGHDVYCLDSSKEMMNILKKDFKDDRLLLQSVFNPINTKVKFDVITSLRFFDHFSIMEQEKIIKNTRNNLSKSGYYIYTVLNKNSFESILSRFFPYGKVNYYYNNKKYTEVFSNNGLIILTFTEKFIVPRGVFLKANVANVLVGCVVRFDKLLSKIIPQLGSLYVYLLENRA